MGGQTKVIPVSIHAYKCSEISHEHHFLLLPKSGGRENMKLLKNAHVLIKDPCSLEIRNNPMLYGFIIFL